MNEQEKGQKPGHGQRGRCQKQGLYPDHDVTRLRRLSGSLLAHAVCTVLGASLPSGLPG